MHIRKPSDIFNTIVQSEMSHKTINDAKRRHDETSSGNNHQPCSEATLWKVRVSIIVFVNTVVLVDNGDTVQGSLLLDDWLDGLGRVTEMQDPVVCFVVVNGDTVQGPLLLDDWLVGPGKVTGMQDLVVRFLQHLYKEGEQEKKKKEILPKSRSIPRNFIKNRTCSVNSTFDHTCHDLIS